MVLRQGMILALLGIAVGLLGALALTRFMTGILAGVPANDPVTFTALATLFAGIAATACYFPARRATQVNPVESLQEG